MLKTPNWKIWQLIGCALLLAAAVTGCGPTPMPAQTNLQNQESAITSALSSLAVRGAQSNAGSSSSSSGSSTTTTTNQNVYQGWNCPAYDIADGSAGNYQICTNPANAAQLLVSFTPTTNVGSVCVFPWSYSAQQEMTPQCASYNVASLTTTAVAVTFPQSYPTQVLIMNSTAAAAQFIQYLSGTAACPAYSEGFVQ